MTLSKVGIFAAICGITAFSAAPVAACETLTHYAAPTAPDIKSATKGKSLKKSPVFSPLAQEVFNAALRGNEYESRKLIPRCTDFISTTAADDGTTLLRWALEKKSKRAFALLLRLGADPEQTTQDGDTVIHDAARHQDPAWLKLLLDQRFDVNVRNLQSGTVPLSRALIARRDKQFEMLLEAGADPNIADNTGNTALHVAAQINKPWHVYKLLTNLAYPADPFIINAQGQTFQHYLFMAKDENTNKRTREGRQLVLDYLWIKDIPIEPGAPPRRNQGFKL
jgi:uncharacterized protein